MIVWASRAELSGIEERLTRIERILLLLLQKERKMSEALDRLEAEVNRNTTVVGSVLTLIQTLSQEIKDAGTDPVKLAAITDKLDSNDSALSQAVIDNTPPPINAPPAPAAPVADESSASSKKSSSKS